MNAAYFEMIGGASGNMILGALIDAGADAVEIERALRTIPVGERWSLVRERVVRRGIAATYVDFRIEGADERANEHYAHRHLADVLAIIDGSELHARQKARARAMYTRLAEAEARVHGTSVAQIHFHEVGQVDAILDVAGTCVAIDLLDIGVFACSAYPLGRGSITMLHGTYPNPPPATAELMRGAPTYDAAVEGEMVTTTGAAILGTLVAQAGTRPALRFDRVGYGAGSNDWAIPNVLRVVVGALDETQPIGTTDEVGVLETNIDDMNPQFYDLAFERLFAAGALDVWTQAITMKKGRPALLLGAIVPADRIDRCARILLEETTTSGVRVRRERRYTLERTTETMTTPYGVVRYKTMLLGQGRLRRTLEYDDLRRIAVSEGRPLAELAAEIERLLPTDDH